MKRFQYFTHVIIKQALYRFPVNNTTSGECFGVDKRWRGGEVKRITPSNWTKISRDDAQKQFPRAFREVK